MKYSKLFELCKTAIEMDSSMESDERDQMISELKEIEEYVCQRSKNNDN